MTELVPDMLHDNQIVIFWNLRPKLSPSLQPKRHPSPTRRGVSVSIGSHGIEPHHLQRPQTTISPCKGVTSSTSSNFKQDTIQGCFLSVNDDSVVLPDRLRPAPPIDFIPTILRGSRCALFSVLHQHSASDLFHQIHFSLRRPPLPTLFHPSHLTEIGSSRRSRVVSTKPLHRQGLISAREQHH